MKNVANMFKIIALAMMIMLLATACGDDSSNNDHNNNHGQKYGWPPSATLTKFGISGLTDTGFAISPIYLEGAKALTIDFVVLSVAETAVVSYIENYFITNGWVKTSGIYIKGSSSVLLLKTGTIAGNPNYTLHVAIP